VKGLEDKVVLVTGATGILGRAIVARFATEGSDVLVASRDLSKAERTIREQNVGGRCIPVELDLVDSQSIGRLVQRLSAEPGLPDVIIANASHREGIAIPFAEITHDSFVDLFRTDLAGHMLLVRDVVQALADQQASVVFVSSVYALAGVDPSIYSPGVIPTPIQYAATKAAALGATRWLAAAWGRRGIRVNAVVAGGVASDRNRNSDFTRNYSAKTMLNRMASADEVASAIAFLASDDASYITGECLVVDGGFSAW
jgi:NAD(P)-dependent dehydrogenase (short-subunit alcohol dehydrogenase family)